MSATETRRRPQSSLASMTVELPLRLMIHILWAAAVASCDGGEQLAAVVISG
jgi:hypothetical protein